MPLNEQKKVKVFYVPFSRRGFSEVLLKTAISGMQGTDYSKILFLAPTRRKIKDSQAILHKLTKGVYIPPEMTTIKQFSKKIYSLYSDKNIISRPLMPVIISRITNKGIGYSSIISNFIDEIKQYRPDKDIEFIANELKDTFKELNVPEDGSKRAMEAMDIFKRYQEILAKNNALDENDALKKCAEAIEVHKYAPDVLIADGFYEITPIEGLILKKLIEQSKTTLISIAHDNNFIEITSSYDNLIKHSFNIDSVVLPSEKKPLNLLYVSYAAIDEEVEGIARHIKNQFISGKNRSLDDITIAFPKLNPYENIVRRVFKKFGIPFTFSVSKPAGKTRPFLDLTALLESVSDDYPRLPFSQFLISPHFKKMSGLFRKWIPKISLNSGIIKGKNSWLNLSRGDIADEQFEELHKRFKWIFKKLEPLESIKNTGTFRQFCEALHSLVKGLDFSDENIDTKKQLSQILADLSFIDSLVPSADKDNGLRRFIDSLNYMLNIAESEKEGTGVRVAGFFELRDAEPGYLYFGGLKDGDMPSMPEIDLVLPDSVKTRLGLVNMKKYLRLQKFIFQRLIETSNFLHCSYPSMEADKLFLPSPFLPWRFEITEQTPGILCKEEELLREGKIPLSLHIKEIGNIEGGSLKKQFGKNSFIRVTDIDSYGICPRKFFIEKILGVEPSQIKEYEIEAMLLGTIIHAIMEGLIAEPFANFEEMRLKAEKLLATQLQEQPIEDYWKNFIRDSFLAILPEIYEIESKLKEEGYFFMRAEVPVEGEIIEGIKLKGKIDRVDKKDDVVELIDYKTGSAQLSSSDILNKGASLQLFLYAALMKSLGFKVSRIGIYSLKDIKISWIPGKNDSRKGLTIENYIKICLEHLDKKIANLRKGDFTASPLNDQTCRNCHERPYCPYIQT